MKVVLSYRLKEPEVSYGRDLQYFLEKEGHQVVYEDEKGSVVGFTFGTQLYEADVIIFLLSENGDLPISDKLYALRNFKRDFQPLVIPVLFKKDIRVPFIPTGSWFLEIYAEGMGVEEIFNEISLAIRTYKAAKEQTKEEQKEKEEKVQTGLSNYLNDTMTRLKENEARNMILAYGLYGLSLVPLAVSIVIALRTSITNAENTIAMAVQAITAFFVILLFVSMSKLLFTLAKSFMVESIRCSDRIHAISFGKFFLDAYGNDATREEVLKAFNTWNIDDGKTTFRNQSGDDYDPKLENIISAVKDVYKSK